MVTLEIVAPLPIAKPLRPHSISQIPFILPDALFHAINASVGVIFDADKLTGLTQSGQAVRPIVFGGPLVPLPD